MAYVAAFLFFIAFFPALRTIVSQWANSEDYMHAFITLPIIAFMIWEKRTELKKGANDGSSIGLLFAMISSALYIFSLHARIVSLSSFCIVTTLLGTTVYFLGFAEIKLLSIPLILLYLLIPIPPSIYSAATLPLQLNVSQVSEAVIVLFNVPVFREGNVLNIPGKTFQMVQACSGMRSIITLITLSLILGYFTFSNSLSKFLLVITSIPVALFVNIVRIVALILVFHFLNIDLSIGTNHTLLGMCVFIIALTLLFLVQRIITFWENKFSKKLKSS